MGDPGVVEAGVVDTGVEEILSSRHDPRKTTEKLKPSANHCETPRMLDSTFADC
jgi:hypothetical protein